MATVEKTPEQKAADLARVQTAARAVPYAPRHSWIGNQRIVPGLYILQARRLASP